MEKTITFGKLAELEETEAEYKTRVPFAVVDSALVGKPREDSCKEHHVLEMSVTDMKGRTWQMGLGDMAKVLFEYGKDHIRELVAANRLSKDQVITMPKITVNTHREDGCPFNPDKITVGDQAGFTVAVEPGRPPIGFKP
jgi:hypothetical protein